MRNQPKRMKRRKVSNDRGTYAMLSFIVLVAITAVCVRVAYMADEPQQISEEYRMYLEGQEPSPPQTWEELSEALADEIPEDAEAPYEAERIEEALLAKGTKIEDVTVSHYCICKRCCGKDESHPDYGITASGRAAAPGTSVAVDPNMIPLGSDVLVDYGDGEIHYYRADDTGGAIKGARIDLCVEDHETALALGLRKATVWYIEGEDND